jgi:hypothetical protein
LAGLGLLGSRGLAAAKATAAGVVAANLAHHVYQTGIENTASEAIALAKSNKMDPVENFILLVGAARAAKASYGEGAISIAKMTGLATLTVSTHAAYNAFVKEYATPYIESLYDASTWVKGLAGLLYVDMLQSNIRDTQSLSRQGITALFNQIAVGIAPAAPPPPGADAGAGAPPAPAPDPAPAIIAPVPPV